jgi:hypothetical protein
MATNAVLGGREIDVRLYAPSGTAPYVVSIQAASVNGQESGGLPYYNATGEFLTFLIPAAPVGKTWQSGQIQWLATYDTSTTFTETAHYTVGTASTDTGTATARTAGVQVLVTIPMSTATLALLNANPGTNGVSVQVTVPASYAGIIYIAAERLILSTGGSAWQRAALPDYQVESVDFELTNLGGWGEGHVALLANWESYTFTGNERVDIWDGAGANLLYRGDLRLPESQLALPETKTLALYGRKAACSDWLIGRRYVYATLTDLATVVADLYSDVVLSNDSGAIADLQATGAYVQPGEVLDWTASNLATAMDSLVARAPDQCYWGWDVAPGAAAPPANRIYIRPRPTSNVYDFVVGGAVQAVVGDVDATQIVNSIHIVGGPATQPNLCNNGGFERPIAANEYHGNLLIDGNFDSATTGADGTNPYWTLLNNASFKSTSAPGGAQSNPNDGSYWVSLDQNTETVQQVVSISDISRVLRACAWIRRGTVGTAATCNLYLDAMDASNTVLASIGHPSNPIDPGLLSTSIGDSIYQRVSWDGDIHTYPTCTQVRFRIVGNSGTNNNDGVFVDTCGLWFRDFAVQQAWTMSRSSTLSQPSGPVSPLPVIDWTHKSVPAPLAGGYCIKVAAQPVSYGWVEVQQEIYAKVSGKRYQTYTVMAQFRTDSGDATVTAGAYGYKSDGSLWAVLEGDRYVGGADGNWHSVVCTISIQDADADLQPFFRVYSTGNIYFDNVMVVEAGPPPECLESPAGDQNWWEGSAYEWTVRSDNSSLGLSADLVASPGKYGVRSRVVNQALVIDRPSAVAFAAGYFGSNAGPLAPIRVTVANDEIPAGVGLGGLARIHNLPAGTLGPYVPVRVRWQYTADRVVCDVDLSNRRPDMAYLFFQELGVSGTQAGQMQQSLAAGGGSSGGSGPFSGGSGYGTTGAPSLANCALLTGSGQIISDPTTFRPATDVVVLKLQREAVGQTSPMTELLDETGAVLAQWGPDGIVTAPALAASGLTGAAQASRHVGATVSGHPTVGTFAVGDYVIDRSGAIWICTAAGTPGTWSAGGGGGAGTVTSVGLTDGSGLFIISGSPITASGVINLALVAQAANQIFAGPASGTSAAPAFRPLAAADIPAILGAETVNGALIVNSQAAATVPVTIVAPATPSQTANILEVYNYAQPSGYQRIAYLTPVGGLQLGGPIGSASVLAQYLYGGVTNANQAQVSGSGVGGGHVDLAVAASSPDASVNINLTAKGTTGKIQMASPLKLLYGYQAPLVTKTAAYTASTADYTIQVDATTASFTLTLPTVASPNGGIIYRIVKITAANTVTVAAQSGQTINGAATVAMTTQWQRLTIQSDSVSNWLVVGT